MAVEAWVRYRVGVAKGVGWSRDRRRRGSGDVWVRGDSDGRVERKPKAPVWVQSRDDPAFVLLAARCTFPTDVTAYV